MDLTNNLKNCRVYLVGAMDRVKDGGVGWRETISKQLSKMGIKILDPCKKLINKVSEEMARPKIELYKKTGQFGNIKKEFGMIRCADLRCVDVSDFIIAHIDISTHACGTYEEIVTANRQKKPILVWCEQGKQNAPNWLFFMLPHEHIFSSMEEIIKYLEEINKEEDTTKLSRWVFFADINK
jgi:hypothetical protein